MRRVTADRLACQSRSNCERSEHEVVLFCGTIYPLIYDRQNLWLAFGNCWLLASQTLLTGVELRLWDRLGCLGPCKSIRELKQRRFWATKVNGKWGFLLFICLDAIKCSSLTFFFSLLKTIYPRVLTKPLPNDAKSHFRLMSVAQKRCCLSSLISLSGPWQCYLDFLIRI